MLHNKVTGNNYMCGHTSVLQFSWNSKMLRTDVLHCSYVNSNFLHHITSSQTALVIRCSLQWYYLMVLCCMFVHTLTGHIYLQCVLHKRRTSKGLFIQELRRNVICQWPASGRVWTLSEHRSWVRSFTNLNECGSEPIDLGLWNSIWGWPLPSKKKVFFFGLDLCH